MSIHAPASFVFLFQSIWKNRQLITQMTKREVLGRYQGSAFGLLWSFFNPILMLVVYTFVFSVVFKARWEGGSDSKAEFALVLFAGLVVFNLFSECLIKSPGLIVNNVNYVKKIIFPLELLPIISLGSALFHFLISFGVWFIFFIIFFGMPNLTILLLPIVLLPLVLLILGVSWFLAALSVYLRDTAQIVTLLTTILMFLSPIFYPITALPFEYRTWMQISPLTFVIEQTRDVIIWGHGIHWAAWSAQMIASVIISTLGYAWFQKTRKGFADVL
ncbi:MAG: ABC transporter permease [Halothiobacillus sp.]